MMFMVKREGSCQLDNSDNKYSQQFRGSKQEIRRQNKSWSDKFNYSKLKNTSRTDVDIKWTVFSAADFFYS